MFGRSQKTIKRLLVIRLSAMGDVAMTVPVVHSLATQHPELRITVLTRSRLTPLFEWLPANVQTRGVDFQENDGVKMLTRLYAELKKAHFDAVADLHDVLRTKFLSALFTMSGTPVATINKGRKEKKALIGNGQRAASLMPTTERYADVFRALGLSIDLSVGMRPNLKGDSLAAVRTVAGRKQDDERWIGVAPFAAHAQKVYPLERMHKVVEMLAREGCKVFLFGAGKSETETLAQWESENVVSCCGKLGGLHNEMMLMSMLDLMLSMDSANMHIAAMLGVPVLSIWGATHPKAGFTPYGQGTGGIVERDLPCRPCSIYGNKPCKFGDLRCMDISEAEIVERAMKVFRK